MWRQDLLGANTPNREAAARGRTGYCYLGNHVGIARTHRGHKIFVDTRDFGITPHIVILGEWERAIEDVIVKLCTKGATVVEVGANIGYHTLAIASAIGGEGRLHSFEANPEIFRLLDLTVEVNNFRKCVMLYHKAALDTEGEIQFYFKPEEICGGHVELPGEQGEADKIAVSIKAASLDKELGDRLDTLDLLRMDAEGSEPFIIRGAKKLLQRSPRIKIVMEWDMVQLAPRLDVPQFLKEMIADLFRFWRIESDRRLIPVSIDDLLNLPHHDLVMARHDVIEDMI